MAWRKILVLGLIASAAFAGCTVTTDDPDDDEDGGSGGSSSSGGAKATGGSGSGGKATGGSSSGGSKATGGTGGGDGGPTECGKGSNACDSCVQEKCCEEWLDCGSDPYCSYKSDDEPGELLCMQSCLIDQVGDAAVIDVQECAGRCAEGSAGVSDATSALIACIRAEGEAPDDGGAALQNCSLPCFGTEL